MIAFRFGCAICGVERAENEPAFTQYQIGRFSGRVCPGCRLAIEGAMAVAVQERMRELALERRKGA